MTAYDTVQERISAGDRLKTPDARTGKPFEIESMDSEKVTVRTASGGRVRVSLFTFDSAIKYLEDRGHTGDSWLATKDEEFQSVLNLENDRVRASSYVLAILGAAGMIEIDGSRPNKVRLI